MTLCDVRWDAVYLHYNTPFVEVYTPSHELFCSLEFWRYLMSCQVERVPGCTYRYYVV